MNIKAVILAGLILCGCTRMVYLPSESVKSDMLLRGSVSVDTIYARDSIIVDRSGDTVRERSYRLIYKTRAVHDTTLVARADNVVSTVVVDGKAGASRKIGWIAVFVATVAAVVLTLRFISYRSR